MTNNMDFMTKVIFAVSLIAGLANGRCPNLNEIEICKDTGICICRPCLSCPKGYGLNIECWGRLKSGTAMKCIPCIKDKTYSNENSTSRCQLCPQCDGKRVIQKCSTTTPTNCSSDECEEGYEYNPVVDSCEPVQTPPPKSTVQPLMTTHQSPTIQSKSSKDPVTQVSPTSSYIAVKLQTGSDINQQETKRETTNKNVNTGHSKPHLVNTTILVIVCVLLFILIAAVVAIIYWYRKKICVKRTKGDNDMEMEQRQPLKENSSQDSPSTPHQKGFPKLWPVDLLLSKIPYPLSCHIQTKICEESPPKVHGWRSIGNEVEIPNKTLDAIGNHNTEERGKELFGVLDTSKTNLTLTKFVEVLEKLNREDVVVVICEYYQKHNIAVDITKSQENL